MLARPAEHANQFTRRDAGRLTLATLLKVKRYFRFPVSLATGRLGTD